MMAAEQYFIYSGGGRDVVPREATHVSIDESVTVISEWLFLCHPNIIELICHAGVKRIEQYAFAGCVRLKRLIIPGVEIVGGSAFFDCEAVTYVECPKLERIGALVFHTCTSLSDINLPSAKIVEIGAFGNCPALLKAKFGKNLESIEEAAFSNCPSLERITIPLKNGVLSHDNTFQGCDNLRCVDLVEGEVLHDTIDALHFLEGWRNDMNEEVDSINQVLPSAYAGYYDDEELDGDDGEKAVVVREWITCVLRKINDYKAKHRHILNEATAALQLVLPDYIVMNNVISFLELPLHTFEGEDEMVHDDEGSSNSNDDSDESHYTSHVDDNDKGEGYNEGVEEEDCDNDDECEEQDGADMAVGRKRRKTADDGGSGRMNMD